MKGFHKQKISSFQIIKNSYGGELPAGLESDHPPKTVITVTDFTKWQSFLLFFLSLINIQIIAIFFSSITKQIKTHDLLAIIFYPLFILISPYIFVKFAKKTSSKSKFETLGFISPVRSKRIYVSVDLIKEMNIEISDVISHENIHCLQYLCGDLSHKNRMIDKERVQNYCKIHMNTEEQYKPKMCYLLSKVEIEARVHELVSTFYTKTNEVILTRENFIVSLIYSNDVFDTLNSMSSYDKSQKMPKFLDEVKINAEKISIFEPVQTSTYSTLDFCDIFNDINTMQELIDFISYGLPTYYANVLKLYGCITASEKLHRQINEDRKLCKR